MTKLTATNRKAFRDYFIIESFECGIELKGCEVKSLREARINLEEAYARVEEGGVMLYGAHISPYTQASYLNVETTRARRLLLHKAQIKKLTVETGQKKYALIPLKVYFNSKGLAKIELGLCKGKKLYDKRQDIRRREQDLEMRRMLKNRRK